MPDVYVPIDSLNGSAHHIAQNVDVAIVAAAEPRMLRDHARARRWNNLRLLSCGSNTFKYDLMSEDKEGRQDSAMSVFTKEPDGSVRHFYTGHPWLGEDVRERGLDLLSPVYHMLDYTPRGRGNWYARLDYGVEAPPAADRGPEFQGLTGVRANRRVGRHLMQPRRAERGTCEWPRRTLGTEAGRISCMDCWGGA